MGFLRRDKRNGSDPATAIGSDPGPDARPDDAAEPMVRELSQVVAENVSNAPLERDTLEFLQIGLPHLLQRECSAEAVVAGQTAARLGYLARSAEIAMFEGELSPDADLLATLQERLDAAEAEGMSGGDAMADLAAAMVAGEALDPVAHEGGPTWTLPGLGAAARGNLRDGLVARMPCPPDLRADDLKQAWKYGYFLCALDELCED